MAELKRSMATIDDDAVPDRRREQGGLDRGDG